VVSQLLVLLLNAFEPTPDVAMSCVIERCAKTSLPAPALLGSYLEMPVSAHFDNSSRYASESCVLH